MLKSTYLRIILIAIALASMSLIAGFAQAQREGNKQPIRKEGLINALKQLHRGDSQAEIVSQIRGRGVDFELTPAIEADLRGAGAGSEMIEAIGANYRLPVLPKAGANEIAFWNSIKDSANPDDYRAYLKKYPDGQFAQDAQNQVNSLEAAANENRSWNSIKDSTNPDDYRAYLNNYPNGKHADSARNQIDALERTARQEAARTEQVRRKEEEAKEEEARRKEAEEKKRAGTVVRNQIGMELVYVPAGTFMMGSNNEYERERPAHQVTIEQGFFMGKYEVTQAEWRQVMGNNRSHFKGDRLPVDKVSWNEAQSFIRKLNDGGEEFSYRLPSEAEWEYASRAGTTTKFAFGDSLSSDQANCNGNEPDGGAEKGVFRQKTTPVGSFQPNAFGLYDMHGNVAEWCEDWYHETYAGAPTDGNAWLSGGEQKDRVQRGGSWLSAAYGLSSAHRQRQSPEYRYETVGFRVVAVARAK